MVLLGVWAVLLQCWLITSAAETGLVEKQNWYHETNLYIKLGLYFACYNAADNGRSYIGPKSTLVDYKDRLTYCILENSVLCPNSAQL